MMRENTRPAQMAQQVTRAARTVHSASSGITIIVALLAVLAWSCSGDLAVMGATVTGGLLVALLDYTSPR
jgi:hypothetical protein